MVNKCPYYHQRGSSQKYAGFRCSKYYQLAKEPVKFTKNGLPNPVSRGKHIQQLCFGEYQKCDYFHLDAPEGVEEERVECPFCGWKFTQRGIVRHQRFCERNPTNARLPDDPIHSAILSNHCELRDHLLTLLQEGYKRDGFRYQEDEGLQIITYFLSKEGQRFKLEQAYNFGSLNLNFKRI